MVHRSISGLIWAVLGRAGPAGQAWVDLAGLPWSSMVHRSISGLIWAVLGRAGLAWVDLAGPIGPS